MEIRVVLNLQQFMSVQKLQMALKKSDLEPFSFFFKKFVILL